MIEILGSEGIPFDNLHGTFKKVDDEIAFTDTRAEGFSLGLSINGKINIEMDEIDITGVMIPAYAINALINKIPIVGKILTGIKGEGIIGVKYYMTGKATDPDVTINPLSILTPGIIRSVLDIFTPEEGNGGQKIEDGEGKKVD